MPGKILIIDDDDLVCISLKRLLVKLDFDAEFCMKAEEAFQVIEKDEPDVILLDIYLTTHNGLELLKEIQKLYFHIPMLKLQVRQ